MMKATATAADGRTIVVLGLSHANLERLRQQGLSGFINVAGHDLGIPFDVMITAAPTERDLLEAFQQLIGPDTKLHIDKRLKD